jgi:hypothetical protein
MPIYQLFIRGENFRWKQDDAITLMGFYTTRWLEASDETAAEIFVIEALRSAPELQKPDWHDGSGPNAKVYVNEINEIISGWDGKAGGGLIWFEEGSLCPNT